MGVVHFIRVLPWGACAVLATLFACAPLADAPAVGVTARSSILSHSATPSGLKVAFPGWCAGWRAQAVMAEVEAGVTAFSAVWGSPVRPTLVTIWPHGWEAFPGDQYDTGLLRGYADKDRRKLLLAWYEHQRPHLPSLGHELGHLADPDASEDDVRSGSRFQAAQIATNQAQTAARPEGGE